MTTARMQLPALPDAFRKNALAFPDKVKAALAKISTKEDAVEFLGKGDALLEYAKRIGADRQAINAIQYGRLLTIAKLGEAMPAAQGKGGGRGKRKLSKADLLSFSRPTLSAYRRVARHHRQIDRYHKLVSDDEQSEATLAGFLKFVGDDGRKTKARVRAAAEKAAVESIGSSKPWRVTAKQDTVACSAVITDPPYGILDQDWEPSDLESFTREWLSRWAACGADFFLVFWSQRFLWEGRTWFDESLAGYHFQQLLVWHYRNNKSPQSREGFKQTWEPVFFYRRNDSQKQILVSGEEWGEDLHDFDCHVAAVPQSNFDGAEAKSHPAQKPVAVMRWLVNAATLPGELVADPFCGSGTTGIAAAQLGRRFHGIETNEDYLRTAKGRISLYGKNV